MAPIQKVKNKTGYSYHVIIRKTGHKTITKTLPNKNLAHKKAWRVIDTWQEILDIYTLIR